MLQRNFIKIGLLSSLFLIIAISSFGQTDQDSFNEKLEKLPNEGTILMLFHKNEVLKKLAKDKPELTARVQDKIDEYESRKKEILSAFEEGFTFCNVVYVEANEEDLRKLHSGDLSDVKPLVGSTNTSYSDIVLLLDPVNSDNDKTGTRAVGFTISPFMKGVKLPRRFPDNIQKHVASELVYFFLLGIPGFIFKKDYPEMVTLLQHKLNWFYGIKD